jgi:hypothetical protein
MELKKNEQYLVESFDEHSDGPSQVDSGTNIASSVKPEASEARQSRVMLATLKHCRISKEQNEALRAV